MQPVAADEVDAFREALNADPGKRYPVQHVPGLREPESHSDFSALSETQYGKL